jgi:PBP superfamily domain
MKIKNIITSIAAGAALLTFAGLAAAAPTMSGDVNVYGSSAQFNFWKAQAANYMTAAGCSSLQASKTTDGKNAITKGTCGGVTRYFRTSSKASYDGPLAIQGNTTNPNRTTACSDPHQRMMQDETSVTSWGTVASPTTMANTAVACKTVNVGASDVEVTSFVQSSHGNQFGPVAGPVITRNFTGTGSVTSTGMTSCKPLVVPFAFYINNSVTKNGGQPVTDLTTAQVRLIFSGQIFDWSDLGVGFDAKPMFMCMRHAGSGTVATLDFAVMRPALLANTEDTSSPYFFYFNDGSADELNCLNYSGGTMPSIGYSDADANITGLNVHQVTYNGVAATKANITAGKYDFYTVQNLFAASPMPADIANMCTFMSIPTNNTNAYYAAECELNYIRPNDQAYAQYNNDFGNCPL